MNWIEQRIRRAEQGDTELDLSVDPWNAGARDKFSEFPASILGLKHLTKLDLSGHDIKVLPIGFSKLESLRELSLRQNKGLRLQNGRELPSQLTHLDLSFLEQLGDIRFERLASLRSLTLAYSGLERFPAGILSLSRLENLRLQGCPLRSLPTTFSRLQNLRTFSIGGEGVNLSLADISVITELQCLQELALIDFDSVEELEIAALRDLSRLQLLDCPLDAIPSSWREFRRLRELRLTLPDTKIARPIAKLEEILSFNQLRVLHLERISCAELMPKISALSELISLGISSSPLARFPPDIFQLTRLESLGVPRDDIPSLPKDIGQLRSLKYLDLSGNPITMLPEEVGELEQLESLWLFDVNLTEVPKCIAKLRNIRRLSLARSNLRGFPVEVLELSALEELWLLEMGIKEIPKSITQLQNLTELMLMGNEITAIPPEIAQLPLLKQLRVSDNPITTPQPEIVAGGTAAIQEYFTALLESSSGRLFEAKMIIVGAGEVGKTCLAQKLVDPDFDIEENKKTIDTTRGIAIKKWRTETEVTDDFKINIWDFGGQEIYHATHQFFLTKRSLYLFVWDARREDHIQGFDYWLSVVKLLSDSSPVLVVLNKADTRIKELDQKSLKDKFDNIAGFYKVSALTGQGIPELIRDVKRNITTLPHVGDVWPSTWSRVRSNLEAEAHKRDYMDLEEYLEICAAAGLTGSQADTVSFYLHNLGVILHFREDPVLHKIVILRPEWGTNAVYAVLDTKKIQENNGRFSFKDLGDIWGHTAYPRSRHTELLQLMKRFELCFQLEGSDDYIAPELLSERPPKLPWDDSAALRFEYNYDFMPAGVITRFIARNHSLVEGNFYWRNGVLLAWEGARALVVAEPLNRKIKVSVVGNEKKDVLTIIRRDFEVIHRTLNSPNVLQMVPCICPKCQMGRDPFFFEYKRLRGFQENRIQDITCEKSWTRVSVDALLTGIFEKSELVAAPLPSAPETRIYIQKVEHYHAMGGPVMTAARKTEPAIQGPWFSGLFYLVSLILLMALLAAIGKLLPWWALPVVVIGGLLSVTVVGALQLKQDQRLSEQGFLKLMALAFRQLPLLKQVLRKEEKPAEDHGEG